MKKKLPNIELQNSARVHKYVHELPGVTIINGDEHKLWKTNIKLQNIFLIFANFAHSQFHLLIQSLFDGYFEKKKSL